MTVTANTTRNDYTAGSAQSVYNYTFQLNEAADVDVYLDGVKQTLNTHYTVQNIGNASGGTITFTLVDANNNPIHPTQGAIINIVMAMDLDRDTNYQPSGAFLAADVNNDFDRLWLATNQQQTAVNRSLRLQDDDVTTSSMELPLKDARKGKLLGFNATTGDPEATTNNQSNWDSAYNDTITSASFSGSTLTLGQRDGNSITATHTPYLPIAGGTLTGDVEFGANKAKFVGLEIYNTFGNNSIIEETGSGSLYIRGEDVRIQTPTGEELIKGEANGAVTLYYDDNPKLETTNTGISITGTLSATGYNDANWDTAYNDKINAVSFSSSNNTLTLTQQDGSTLTTIINGSLTGGGETLAETLAIGNTTGGNDISFGDNDKAKFGASDDLQIYHNGTHSYIDEVGTGSLYIRANDFRLSNADGSQNHIIANNNGEVSLRYSGSPKLATTSTGIDVSGTVKADTHFTSSDSNATLSTSGTGGAVRLRPNGISSENGQVIVDSSGNVGIGTSSPPYLLTTNYNANATFSNAASDFTQMWQNSGTNGLGVALADDSTARLVTNNGYALAFNNATSEAMRIDSSGNVIVGGTTAQQTSAVTLTQGGSIINDGFIKPATDASYDIGSSSQRYKDIHLSGKVYVPDVRSSGVQYFTHTTDVRFRNTSGNERMRIDSSGNLLVGTSVATTNAKLKVDGAAILDDSVTYTKNYSYINTTGQVVAKATGGNNGSSTTFIFTGQGGTGTAFHIVYAARNQGGYWSAVRSEVLLSGAVDVVASSSGTDVLFTFKSKSGSQGYSPKVKITTVGSNYDTTYLA